MSFIVYVNVGASDFVKSSGPVFLCFHNKFLCFNDSILYICRRRSKKTVKQLNRIVNYD